jgi:hypothetical protein
MSHRGSHNMRAYHAVRLFIDIRIIRVRYRDDNRLFHSLFTYNSILTNIEIVYIQ